MVKRIIILFCLSSLLYSMCLANDVEDFKYIYKLHQNNLAKNVIEESETFLKKYPNSKMNDSVINILANNYYETENYSKAKFYFDKLNNTQYKKDSYYYLAMMALKNGEISTAEKYVGMLDNKTLLKTKGIYNLAEFFFSNKEYDKAEEYFKILIKENGKFYNESQLKLGIIYYEKGDYMKTITMLEAFLENTKSTTTENAPLIYYMLGYSNDKIKDVESAVKYYEKIATNYLQSEYYAEAVYNLAKIDVQAKKYDTAYAFVEALKGTKYYYDGMLMIGELAYEKEQYETAASLYTTISNESSDPKILFKTAVTYIKTEKYNEALEILNKIKESEYKDEFYYYSVYIYYKQNEYKKIDEIISSNETDLQKNRYYNDMLVIISETEYILKNYQKSYNYYQKLYSVEKREESKKKALYRLVMLSSILKNDDYVKKYYDEFKQFYSSDTEYKKDVYLISAQYFIDRKQYGTAESIYKDFITVEMDDAILRNLVAVLLQQEKYTEMEIYLKRLPDTSENTYLLGVTYMNLHNYDRAELEFKKVINGKEMKFIEDAYLNMTDSQYLNGRYAEMIKYCQEYSEKDLKKHLQKIQARRGAGYFKLKRYEEALSVYESLKTDKEVSDFAYFMSAEALYNMKKFTEAVSNYGYVIENYKDSTYRKDSLYWTISITYENKLYDLCIQNIKLMLKDYPNTEYAEDATYYMANIYMDKNQIEEAVKGYEQVVKMTSKKDLKESISTRLITEYFGKGDYINAMKWTEKLPPSSLKTLWIGIIYTKTGKQLDAVKRFESIINDADNGDKALYYLGDYYLEKKQYDKARNYYTKVLEYSVSEYKDDAVLKVGYSYENEGNYQKAVTTLLRIKLMYENSPLQEITTLKIAEDYEKLNDGESAFKYYVEFYNKYKDSQYYSGMVERIVVYYLNKQDTKSAAPYYEELIKLNKDRADIYKKYFN